MREVETVQPLASLPTSGRTLHCTTYPTTGQRISIPSAATSNSATRHAGQSSPSSISRSTAFNLGGAKARSHHELEVLGDPPGHIGVAGQFESIDVRVGGGPPADQAREQNPVHLDRRGRQCPVEAVHHP